jgi:hypothetical protein
MAEGQPFKLLTAGSNPADGTIVMGTLEVFPNPPALALPSKARPRWRVGCRC